MWYLNPALTTFRNEVNARYTNRDKTSDGTIGDEQHQAGISDHNPDADGSVDAWDMDVEVNGVGKPYLVDIEYLKDVFEKHPASGYWIHNGWIATRDMGWRRVAYAGANPHDKHVHWNTRSAYENSTAPWNVSDFLTPAEFVTILKDPTVVKLMRAIPWQYVGGGIPVGMSTLNVLNRILEKVSAANDTPVDVAALAEALKPFIAQTVREELDKTRLGSV